MYGPPGADGFHFVRLLYVGNVLFFSAGRRSPTLVLQSRLSLEVVVCVDRRIFHRI
jgi:hypothetical protein